MDGLLGTAQVHLVAVKWPRLGPHVHLTDQISLLASSPDCGERQTDWDGLQGTARVYFVAVK